MASQPPRPPEGPTNITNQNRAQKPDNRGVPTPRPPLNDTPYIVEGGNPLNALIAGAGLVFICVLIACVAVVFARDSVEDMLGLSDNNDPDRAIDLNTNADNTNTSDSVSNSGDTVPTPTNLPALGSTLDPNNVAPPDGDLLFVSNRSGQWEIWVMEADGSAAQQITRSSSDVNYSPGWSPDGSQIVFEARRNGNWDIFVMNADGTNVRQLTTNAATDRVPTWSPDGSTIAFASDRQGDNDIFLIDPNGQNLRQITFGSSTEYYPTWSPDSREVAYQSNRTGTLQIYRQAIDQSDSNAQQLTFGGLNKGAASWSPTGQYIVFYTNVGVGSGQDVYMVSAGGGDLIPLATASYNEVAPSWGPDGRYVYYHAGTRGGTNVLRVDTQSGIVQEITQRSDRNWSPDLRPNFSSVTVSIPDVAVSAPSTDTTTGTAPTTSTSATVFCPNTAPGLLSLGEKVIRAAGTSPQLYSDGNTDSRVIGAIVDGLVMEVLNGPRCEDGATWWYVRYGLTTGWLRETVGQTYQVTSVSARVADVNPPADRNFAPVGASILTGGLGLSSNTPMNAGEFQVEWYCNILGYGVETDGQEWYCTVSNIRLAQLAARDFDAICQASYNNPRAFAAQNGSSDVPAYRWLCYGN